MANIHLLCKRFHIFFIHTEVADARQPKFTHVRRWVIGLKMDATNLEVYSPKTLSPNLFFSANFIIFKQM